VTTAHVSAPLGTEARPFAGLPVVIEGLRMVYTVEGEQVVALDDADLTVRPGESLALLGPSGAGKSTLLTLVAGLQRPAAGRIWVGRRDLTELSETDLLALRGTDVTMVAQGPARNLLLWTTVEDNVRFSQRGVPRWARRNLPEPWELLESLGMAELLGRRVDQLSGGEKQRLAVAVGMATRPGLLLLDEPTSQLDHENRDRVVDLIRTIVGRFGTTVMAVTHDDEVAASFHRTVTVEGGRLVGAVTPPTCPTCGQFLDPAGGH
jgi:putative ABC transport system ATP-binding protein